MERGKKRVLEIKIVPLGKIFSHVKIGVLCLQCQSRKH